MDFLVGVLRDVFVVILAHEIISLMPFVAERIIRHAVARLPLDRQARWFEQFTAALEQTHSPICKIVEACEYWLSVHRMLSQNIKAAWLPVPNVAIVAPVFYIAVFLGSPPTGVEIIGESGIKTELAEWKETATAKTAKLDSREADAVEGASSGTDGGRLALSEPLPNGVQGLVNPSSQTTSVAYLDPLFDAHYNVDAYKNPIPVGLVNQSNIVSVPLVSNIIEPPLTISAIDRALTTNIATASYNDRVLQGPSISDVLNNPLNSKLPQAGLSDYYAGDELPYTNSLSH